MFVVIHDPNEVEKIINNLHVSVFNSIRTTVGAAANFAVGAGRQEAHVITGHNKRNIQQQKVSDEEINVLAKAIYAGYENARGSDHAFFDKMVARTRQQFPQIAISDVTSAIRKAKLT